MDVLMEDSTCMADGLTPHEDMRIFINICKGVHDVLECQDCSNFKGGQCGFLRATKISCKHTEGAEA